MESAWRLVLGGVENDKLLSRWPFRAPSFQPSYRSDSSGTALRSFRSAGVRFCNV